ncbi:RNaseH domain-containing protein [Sphaerisporangium sp. NPDC088356]|uniref:RNaseH domain-containing protein n=1 Tax=Sphaerisporangium sp. NPDC088356 TaxID=3154871 RepID=UPI00341D04E6
MAGKLRRQLDLLAYRATPALLADATVNLRLFEPGVVSMWRLLDRQYRELVNNSDAQTPYSIATNALRCLTGGYVHLDTDRGFLVSREPIDDDTLCDTFTLLTGLVNGQTVEEVNLLKPSTLAERIAGTVQEERLLADHLATTSGQPNADAWVYQSIGWDLARRFCKDPWEVDGQTVHLRPDSSGGFIAWNLPWSNKAGTAHALARGRMLMKTMANISDPLIFLSASATRIQNSTTWARTVLVEQAKKDKPIIAVELAGRGRLRVIHRMTLQTLARLNMDHSVLHGVQERIDHEERARQKAKEAGDDTWRPPGGPLTGIRPIQSKHYKFPIGTGVGLFFERELDRRFREVFGDTAISPNVVVDTVGMKQRKQTDILPTPEEVMRSLRTMGYQRLRLVCLWYKDENRLRMIRALWSAYRLDTEVDPVDGESVALLDDRVTAVFHEAPRFLKHGPDSGMKEDLDGLAGLQPEQGTLIGVWAETEWDGDEDEQQEATEGEDQELTGTEGGSEEPAGRPGEDEDAKHRSRRTLSRRNITSQYIKDGKKKTATTKTTTPKQPVDLAQTKPKKKAQDHPAIYAQLDLYRSLGIVDRRIDDVMVGGVVDLIGPYKATEVAHCGIHVRRQSKRRGERSAKICVTATVLRPPADPSQAWTLHGWSYTDRNWQPYTDAQNAFHAQDYPEGKMTELVDDNKGHKSVAKTIDQALNDLARYLDGTPYTVTVDGNATRRLWGGLHNNKQGETGKPGTTWLPGYSLREDYRPIAVIRINKDTYETPRPFGATWINEDDEHDTKTTSKSLFRVDPDFGHPTWLLVTVPPQHDGANSGRLGEDKTRWTADHGSNIEGQLRKNEMAANWYAMTATEIYVIPLRDDIQPRPLAVLTARLCNQPLTWANRTRYSAPLHAAQKMDQDHPQYRRTQVAESDDGTAQLGLTDGLD